MTDYTEEEWQEAKSKFESIFGEGLEMDGILFLIGVQELGKGFRVFEKDEKMNLMHIAACKLLEPFKYYSFSHRDDEGWPHYTQSETMPGISKKEQDKLLKQAVIIYSRTEL
ncbi:MAG: hypothetical protein ACI85Q_000067 [Salibacteraceae bacterium]|jgi:hypothetical protein